MEQKITYVKDAHLHIRVDREDLERWKELAKKYDSDLTAFVINTLNGTITDKPRRKNK